VLPVKRYRLAADEGIHPKAPGRTDVTERQFFRGPLSG